MYNNYSLLDRALGLLCHTILGGIVTDSLRTCRAHCWYATVDLDASQLEVLFNSPQCCVFVLSKPFHKNLQENLDLIMLSQVCWMPTWSLLLEVMSPKRLENCLREALMNSWWISLWCTHSVCVALLLLVTSVLTMVYLCRYQCWQCIMLIALECSSYLCYINMSNFDHQLLYVSWTGHLVQCTHWYAWFATRRYDTQFIFLFSFI